MVKFWSSKTFVYELVAAVPERRQFHDDAVLAAARADAGRRRLLERLDNGERHADADDAQADDRPSGILKPWRHVPTDAGTAARRNSSTMICRSMWFRLSSAVS